MPLQTTHYRAGLRLGQVLVLTGPWEFRPPKATVLWYFAKLRASLCELRSMLRARESELRLLDRLEDLVLEEVYRAQEDPDELENFEYDDAHHQLETMRGVLEESIQRMGGCTPQLSSFRLGIELAAGELQIHDPLPFYHRLSEVSTRSPQLEFWIEWNNTEVLHHLLEELDLRLDEVMQSCTDGSPSLPTLPECLGGWESLELALDHIRSEDAWSDSVILANPNQERDRYLYLQARQGITSDELLSEVREHPDWSCEITTRRGIERAIDRYADRESLPRVRRRSRGRPPTHRE